MARISEVLPPRLDLDRYKLVGTKGFEPLHGGIKIHRLTTWRCPKKQRAGRERRGSNPRPRARQARALQLSYFPANLKNCETRLMGERRELNPQLSGPQPDTLPLSYIRPLSPRRLERRTLRLSSVRSNQLSYGLDNLNSKIR